MMILKDRFSEADRAEWRAFFKNYPTKVEDIPAERLHPFTTTSIPQCGMRLPDSQGRQQEVVSLILLQQHTLSTHAHAHTYRRVNRAMQQGCCPVLLHPQTRFAESIRYVNPVSGSSASAADLRNACAEAEEVPILAEGAYICVLPPEDVLAHEDTPAGERLPFWVGRVLAEEEAEVGAQTVHLPTAYHFCTLHSYGRRLDPVGDEDEFEVQWLGVFNSTGNITDSVVGSWKLRCAHRDTRGRSHAWHEERCTQAGHARLCDTIRRETILLYDVEFSAGARVAIDSKRHICRALEPYPFASSLLPDTWKAAPRHKRKRLSRRR
eukprot:6211951-Pleurochrysis_carterae.AAC.1